MKTTTDKLISMIEVAGEHEGGELTTDGIMTDNCWAESRILIGDSREIGWECHAEIDAVDDVEMAKYDIYLILPTLAQIKQAGVAWDYLSCFDDDDRIEFDHLPDDVRSAMESAAQSEAYDIAQDATDYAVDNFVSDHIIESGSTYIISPACNILPRTLTDLNYGGHDPVAEEIYAGNFYDPRSSSITVIGDEQTGYPGDLYYCDESLCRSDCGQYFLVGEGGPQSRYCRIINNNAWIGGSGILRITKQSAQKWCDDAYDECDNRPRL